MLYRLLADFVLVLHLVFIVFVIFGGLLAFKWRHIAWAHLPAMAWGAMNELFGLWCPLTPLENWLRGNGEMGRYETGFIEHYIVPVVYPAGLTRGIQIVIGSVVVVLNVLIYGVLLRRAARPAGRRAEG